MYSAARVLRNGAELSVGEPLTLSEVAFRRPQKKLEEKLPTYATTYFLKTYYSKNKEVPVFFKYNGSLKEWCSYFCMLFLMDFCKI